MILIFRTSWNQSAKDAATGEFTGMCCSSKDSHSMGNATLEIQSKIVLPKILLTMMDMQQSSTVHYLFLFFIYCTVMFDKRNLLILGLVIVISTFVGMLYDSFIFLLFLVEIPVFATSFLAFSFFINSNKLKIIISLPVASVIPLFLWLSIFFAGGTTWFGNLWTLYVSADLTLE